MVEDYIFQRRWQQYLLFYILFLNCDLDTPLIKVGSMSLPLKTVYDYLKQQSMIEVVLL